MECIWRASEGALTFSRRWSNLRTYLWTNDKHAGCLRYILILIIRSAPSCMNELTWKPSRRYTTA